MVWCNATPVQTKLSGVINLVTNAKVGIIILVAKSERGWQSSIIIEVTLALLDHFSICTSFMSF